MNPDTKNKFRKKATKEFNLLTENPSLAEQWYSALNEPMTPVDVVPGSHKKAWWICRRGHTWQAAVKTRVKGVGCPYCAGKAVCEDNSLAVLAPAIAAEWHPTKNGDLTPKDVRPNTHKTVWWSCSSGHKWSAAVSSRFRGSGCPYCSGRNADKNNNLAVANPALAAEWHPTKNGQLKPNRVTPSSGHRAWWRCSNGHEWESVVRDRNTGTGCPYCTNRKVNEENSLRAKHPLLAEEWHPKRNRKVSPDNVTPGSTRVVWWKCSKGHTPWRARISSRVSGAGCPCCSGRVATKKTSLFAVNQALAKNGIPLRTKRSAL